jgi:superoxide dismutase
LYRGYVEKLNAINAAYPVTDWTGQAGVTGSPQNRSDLNLLGTQVAQLALTQPIGPVADALAVVYKEFDERGGKNFRPSIYFGDEDFWTADKSISISVPWFLATPHLWRLSGRTQATNFTFDQVLRCLRHELGHAVFFAYELGQHPLWVATFGDASVHYGDAYHPDPKSQGYVEYLTNAPAHYAQKHPEEAWAEAFGRWLDMGENQDWRAEFAAWPGALAKLEAVEAICGEVLGQTPPNVYLGRPDPYTTLRGTVAERLGVPRTVQPFSAQGWSEHSELLRREPYFYNAVVLHELYFEQFNLPTPMQPSMTQAVIQGWGSVNSFMLDLRAAAGSSHGWVLVVWDSTERRAWIALVEQHHIGVPAGCSILVAIDCWEHSYTADYGLRKDIYLAAVLQGMDWGVVEVRLIVTAGIQVNVVAPVPVVEIPEPDQDFDLALDSDDSGARMAGKEGLVPVEVEIKYKSGKTGTGIRYKKPEVAAKMIAEGKAKAVSTETTGAAIYKQAPGVYKAYAKKLIESGKPVPQHIVEAAGAKHLSELVFKKINPEALKAALAKSGTGGLTQAVTKSVITTSDGVIADPAKAAQELAGKVPKPSDIMAGAYASTNPHGLPVEQLSDAADFYGYLATNISKHVTDPEKAKEYIEYWQKDFLKYAGTASVASAAKSVHSYLSKKIPGLEPPPVFESAAAPKEIKTGKEWAPITTAGAPPKDLAEAAAVFAEIPASSRISVNSTQAFGASYNAAKAIHNAYDSWAVAANNKYALQMRDVACRYLAEISGVPASDVQAMDNAGLKMKYGAGDNAHNNSRSDQAEGVKTVKEGFRAMMRETQAALANDPEYITLYRGMSLSEETVEKARDTGLMPMNVLNSFSFSSAVAAGFGETVFEVKVHKSQISATDAVHKLHGKEREAIVMSVSGGMPFKSFSHPEGKSVGTEAEDPWKKIEYEKIAGHPLGPEDVESS